ncbi:tripartite tricarboxylate transporter substrate binding protein [Corticibacterium sp. UT-5YL-CI-8]|nr:tripartite tricarboxylate transporter substrate binding protein [Tianweitania sp. UT-5YL-CI-8]
MRIFTRVGTAIAAAALALFWLAAVASAAEDQASWPSRPITIYVPYTPGGIASNFVRLQADLLEPILGQPVLIENLPGGGGLIAAEKVARADPDGYTWMSMQSGLVTITPFVNKGFNPAEELKLVATSRTQPMLIVVRQDSPYKSIADIVADAKARPGEVSFGSLGLYSLHHIIGESLGDAAGVKLLHVPYTGSAQYMVDLLAGRVDFVISTAASMAGYAGQLRALGSAQNAKSTLAADIPTSVDYDMPQIDYPSWVGVSAPKNTPQAITDKMDAALAKVDADPKFREQMVKFESEPFYHSAKEFEPQLKEHARKVGALLSKLNLGLN